MGVISIFNLDDLIERRFDEFDGNDLGDLIMVTFIENPRTQSSPVSSNTASKIRNFFPETWLWNKFSNDSTRFVSKTKIPNKFYALDKYTKPCRPT